MMQTFTLYHWRYVNSRGEEEHTAHDWFTSQYDCLRDSAFFYKRPYSELEKGALKIDTKTIELVDLEQLYRWTYMHMVRESINDLSIKNYERQKSAELHSDWKTLVDLYLDKAIDNVRNQKVIRFLKKMFNEMGCVPDKHLCTVEWKYNREETLREVQQDNTPTEYEAVMVSCQRNWYLSL